MDTSLSDFDLLETVRDASKYGDKIDQLIKARKELQESQADFAAATAALKKTKAETDAYVNGRKAELEAAQKEHDAAAQEAADRIQLGQEQAAELLKVKADNESTTARLAAKEKELAGREGLLKDQQSGIAARVAEIDRKSRLLERQLAHIAAMPK